MKRCVSCKQTKSKEQFNIAKKKKDGLQTFCKECQQTTHHLYQQKNKEKLNIYQKQYYMKADNVIKLSKYQKRYYQTYKNYYLKRKYGIDLNTYNGMLKEQNSLCAICKKPESVIDKRNNEYKMLAVDHDHKTGAVRELLCNNCNLFLGRIENDVDKIKNVLIYLDKHRIK